VNTSTPFSPAQQRLILLAIGGFVLIACVNLVRSYHPRFRRSPILRCTPVGMLLLALAVGALALIAFYAIDFVKQHPLRFLGVAVFGLFVFFICAQIDAYRERAIAQASGTTKPSTQWQPRPDAIVRLATWYAGFLACSIITVPFSLYGEFFGPLRGISLAVLAFVISMAVFLLARHPWGLSFLKECPTGLSTRFPGLVKWRKRIERALIPVGLLIFLSIAAMFISSRGAGVPADTLPVFAPREHYILTNRGKRTEVSAARFWLADRAGLVAWHCGTLCASLVALYCLLYGDFPPQFKRDFRKENSLRSKET
jgi:hypothetical protein